MTRTYEITAAKILADARRMLADSRTDMPQRNDDADMIAALNEALRALVGVLPGLFTEFGAHTCTAGHLQRLAFDRATIFVRVLDLPEGDAATLTQFMPGWTSGATGAPVEFMRVAGDPEQFMVYPPAVGDEVLQVQYVAAAPDITTAADAVPVPEALAPALVEYVVGRVEMADDEHVNSGRAAALLERFTNSAKALGV